MKQNKTKPKMNKQVKINLASGLKIEQIRDIQVPILEGKANPLECSCKQTI